jgi:hypothetical protein
MRSTWNDRNGMLGLGIIAMFGLALAALMITAGCSSLPTPTVATTTPTMTNAQVAQKVAACIATAANSAPAGTNMQTELAIAALQCAQGY